MQEVKNASGMPPEVDQDFARFLKQVRMEAKVSLQKLSEGLMTASQLARIEKGQRSVSKNMRDCLLGRLGISSDLYENLLGVEDHLVWERQRSILSAMEQRDFVKAQELLAVHERQKIKGIKDKIKQQFCLVMQAEILKQQGAERCEIGSCYAKAAGLTVPKADRLCASQMLLTIQEVNIVLEYHFYHSGADFAERCRTLIAFVEGSLYDALSRAKIYPKIVYYYLRERFSEQGGRFTDGLGECLELCNRAVEMLRDTGRAYFLLELLEMRIEIVKRMGDDSGDARTLLRESTELAELLKELYAEYGLTAYMQDCAYLYQQRWVFYIGDVLRIRRKMFGMTQEELCGLDCSVKSLRRTEKKEADMQHEAVSVLLRRLGLSKEFQRARLAPNDRIGFKLMEALSVSRSNFEMEQIKTILKQMKEMASNEIPENQQYFMEAEAWLDWVIGKITKEEFARREEEALRCTLKVKDLYDIGEVYLTEMEMLCIRQRIQVLPDAEKRKCIDFLLHFFEGDKKKDTLSDFIAMYECTAICIICELGNLNEHQRSTNLARKVLRECLNCRRIWGIDEYLYEILWNEDKKMTEKLKECIIFSHFCNRTFYEDFYLKKLYQS